MAKKTNKRSVGRKSLAIRAQNGKQKAVKSLSSSPKNIKTSKDLPGGKRAQSTAVKKLRKKKLLSKIVKTQDEINLQRSVAKNGNALGNVADLSEAIALFSKQKTIPKDLLEENQHQSKRLPKRRKTRQKELNQDLDLFNQIMEHPEFIKRPCEAIREHLENNLV